MTSALDTITKLNNAVEPVVGDVGVVQTLEQCLADLAEALLNLESSGLTDSNTSQFIADALVTPFNEVAEAFKDTFVPPNVSGDSASNYIVDLGTAIAQAAVNPVAAILAMQRDVFSNTIDQLSSVLFGDGTTNDFLKQTFDRAKLALSGLFVGGDSGDNIGGLVLYALEYGVPAIDSELQYLRLMKTKVRELEERTTQLPPAFVPQIPNFCIDSKLCEAERHLLNVEFTLRQQNTFSKGEFGAATDAVCSAKDLIASGSIPADIRGQVKNFFGLNDRQLNALVKGNVFPDPRYRIAMIELSALNGYLQKQDYAVISLHRNLLVFVDKLRALQNVKLGDLLALIVQLLRRQIIGLRADVEAQSAGFSGAGAASQAGKLQIEQIPGVPFGSQRYGQTARFGNQGSPQDAKDVYAYLTSQATTYIVLSQMCYTMQRAQRMVGIIDTVLSENNRILNLLANIINIYKGQACGPDNGALLIDQAINNFFRVSEGRLTGATCSTLEVHNAAQSVLTRINAHEKFLLCIREGMTFGLSNLAESVLGGNVLRAMSTINNLINLYPSLRDTFNSLDIDAMLSTDKSHNAVDTLLQALQCLVLQCNNDYIVSLYRQTNQYFSTASNENLSLSSLDGVPRFSQKLALNQRVQSFNRLIKSLQNLTSLKIGDICSVDTTGSFRDPQPSDDAVEPVIVVPASSTVAPFGSSPLQIQ